ncbi:MAG: hypothetical protein AAF441_09180 [Pseudomonadota bacterium]
MYRIARNSLPYLLCILLALPVIVAPQLSDTSCAAGNVDAFLDRMKKQHEDRIENLEQELAQADCGDGGEGPEDPLLDPDEEEKKKEKKKKKRNPKNDKPREIVAPPGDDGLIGDYKVVDWDVRLRISRADPGFPDVFRPEDLERLFNGGTPVAGGTTPGGPTVPTGATPCSPSGTTGSAALGPAAVGITNLLTSCLAAPSVISVPPAGTEVLIVFPFGGGFRLQPINVAPASPFAVHSTSGNLTPSGTAFDGTVGSTVSITFSNSLVGRNVTVTMTVSSVAGGVATISNVSITVL